MYLSVDLVSSADLIASSNLLLSVVWPSKSFWACFKFLTASSTSFWVALELFLTSSAFFNASSNLDLVSSLAFLYLSVDLVLFASVIASSNLLLSVAWPSKSFCAFFKLLVASSTSFWVALESFLTFSAFFNASSNLDLVSSLAFLYLSVPLASFASLIASLRVSLFVVWPSKSFWACFKLLVASSTSFWVALELFLTSSAFFNVSSNLDLVSSLAFLYLSVPLASFASLIASLRVSLFVVWPSKSFWACFKLLVASSTSFCVALELFLTSSAFFNASSNLDLVSSLAFLYLSVDLVLFASVIASSNLLLSVVWPSKLFWACVKLLVASSTSFCVALELFLTSSAFFNASSNLDLVSSLALLYLSVDLVLFASVIASSNLLLSVVWPSKSFWACFKLLVASSTSFWVALESFLTFSAFFNASSNLDLVSSLALLYLSVNLVLFASVIASSNLLLSVVWPSKSALAFCNSSFADLYSASVVSELSRAFFALSKAFWKACFFSSLAL